MRLTLNLLHLLLVASRATNSSDARLRQEFMAFKQRFGRTYTGAHEEERRFNNFIAFQQKVKKRNAQNTATHGVTKFADRSEEEMRMKCGGPRSLVENSDALFPYDLLYLAIYDYRPVVVMSVSHQHTLLLISISIQRIVLRASDSRS